MALAPAGGWACDDESWKDVLRLQATLIEHARAAAPQAEAILATPEGRRRATRYTVVNHEHLPVDLLAHQLFGVAVCRDGKRLVDYALGADWRLHAERIACPVRIVWGGEDQLLPWPSAAARFRTDWLPHADWVELEGVGHCPQLDAPAETADLILGFTA